MDYFPRHILIYLVKGHTALTITSRQNSFVFPVIYVQLADTSWEDFYLIQKDMFVYFKTRDISVALWDILFLKLDKMMVSVHGLR